MLIVKKDCENSRSLITDISCKKGQVLVDLFSIKTSSIQTYQTIQKGINEHLEDLGILAFINHSCDPNIIVDTESLKIIAIRDISPFEEIRFFYPSTEWEMSRPFICKCGSVNCIGMISGAKFLSIDILKNYFINKHIIDLFDAQYFTMKMPSAVKSIF